MSSAGSAVRAIAFYLPQFHPIPENDEWWGNGFTEWTYARVARPHFSGHYQPHVPADHGYYDLRDENVRSAQAALAESFGITGFCYYHYWFGGRRLLERPFDEVLATGRPDFPFCLCWANEPWTRGWDGSRKEILVDQQYSEADDLRHIDWLIEAFRDERYLRVEGKPLFLVYRAAELPNPVRTTRLWRERASRAGLPGIFLCRVESHRERSHPASLGFDAAVEFQPAVSDVDGLLAARYHPRRFLSRLGAIGPEHGYVRLSYPRLVRQMMQREDPPFPRFPCVTPQWDNTPRRPNSALIFDQSTPELFGQWVKAAVTRLRLASPDQRLLFVNAWNEWGEGAHLEPCDRWGLQYLEALAEGLRT